MDSLNKAKYFVVAVFLFLIVCYFSFSAPTNFPQGDIFIVSEGSTLSGVATKLKDLKIIRSKAIFQVITTILGGDKNVITGDYLFSEETSVFVVAYRLTRGIYLVPASRIVILEGETNKDIAETFAPKLRNFNKENFLQLVKEKEGYLFPDTYLFFPMTKEDEVARVMQDNFNKKIGYFQEKIKNSKRSLKDIVIMASIIEKEANGKDDAKTISGILWNRLDKGIPLQVDAPFLYILGKGSADLTTEDLQIDSLFNTYVYKGLPPSPIGNPGLRSIEAALNPAKTPYFFYLHDSYGNIYYARTFAEHQRNIRLYLK